MIGQILRYVPFIAAGIAIVILIIFAGWYVARSRKREKGVRRIEERIRCMICSGGIKRQADIASCPICDNFFHITHIKEWIKIKGSCPVCKELLREKDLVIPQMV